ncbi:MAG TPA: molybdopterin dinucleotide binding domain-containing protein, partial [Desulfobacterales bacterium]|nr:molybdopterin dinucleotide binding domain-containing protein [Desulfobacterales bacterium]
CELFPENVLWINSREAARLGIKDKAVVEVASSVGSGRIRAHVTDLIHPECVFMIHGFGHEAATAARCFRKGLSDSLLQENVTDRVGGSPALHATFVTVKPS